MTGNAQPPVDYRSFLEAKTVVAEQHGFAVDPAELNPALKPHVKLSTIWAAAGGRRALFSRFGTQKTTWHLELARLVLARPEAKPAEPPLIVLPLGARLSFFNDAETWFRGPHAIRLNFIRRDKDIAPGAIHLTNVESVREGLVDPRRFASVAFDEGDILRNMGTKTFWAFTNKAKQVPLRFVGTATPDPRDYTELLAFAGYLDVMDVGQARTRFFKRNSEKADHLTLHPHKEREFWLWVASWALFLQKPSDLDPSFSDEGYELPPLDLRWHKIASPPAKSTPNRDGQLGLIRDPATGVTGAAAEKRGSIDARIAKLMQLRAEDPGAHRLIWHDLEAERRAIEHAIAADTKPRRREAKKHGKPTGKRARTSIRTSIGHIPGTVQQYASVYGSQDLEAREQHLMDFAAGRLREMGGKPSMIGSGPNFQHWCWWAVFLGIGFKFKDLIQAVHRLQRYGQQFRGYTGSEPKRVRVDLIYTEAEQETRRTIERHWKRYEEQAERMAALVREFGLGQVALAGALKRSMGVARREVSGGVYETASIDDVPDGGRAKTVAIKSTWRWKAVLNDCVEETRSLESCSVDLVLTSIPFSGQYEYTPSYNDFGHTDNDGHFFRQMDFLTPELLRVLKPGRVLAIHCKDRVVEGSRSGLGFMTIAPFGADTMRHAMGHGFAYIGTKTIATDVVRENNQTYRLGWTEQCKDGSRMGFGLPEYLHLFRKPQTDRGKGYADEPVTKLKREYDKHAGTWVSRDPRTGEVVPEAAGEGYSRARWQLDAAGFGRSSGDRLLTPAEMAALPHKEIWRVWRQEVSQRVYDYRHHVAVCEALDIAGKLPPDFALAPAHSWHPSAWTPAVWTDVARMRGLNTLQAQAGRVQHLAPLPFDIVERAIGQYTMPGELVFDPFGGVGTVAYCAVKLGRRGLVCELNPDYWRDAGFWCDTADREANAPTLFDLDALDGAATGQRPGPGAAQGNPSSKEAAE